MAINIIEESKITSIVAVKGLVDDLKSINKVGYNPVNDKAIFSKAANCVELLVKQRERSVAEANQLENEVMGILNKIDEKNCSIQDIYNDLSALYEVGNK